MHTIKIAHLKIVIAFTLLPKFFFSFFFFLLTGTQTGRVIIAFLLIPSFPLHVVSDLLIK